MCISKLRYYMNNVRNHNYLFLYLLRSYCCFVVHLSRNFYMHFRWFEKFIVISFLFDSTFVWCDFPKEQKQQQVWIDKATSIRIFQWRRACSIGYQAIQVTTNESIHQTQHWSKVQADNFFSNFSNNCIH